MQQLGGRTPPTSMNETKNNIESYMKIDEKATYVHLNLKRTITNLFTWIHFFPYLFHSFWSYIPWRCSSPTHSNDQINFFLITPLE